MSNVQPAANFFRTNSIFDSIDSVWQQAKAFVGIPSTNPTVSKLLKWQSAAKFTRTMDRIRSPRRMLLTVVAILLTFVWLGQALAGILLRQSSSTATLMKMIPLSLGVYLFWNFIKAAGQKPVEPFEWTETERELLLGSPLKRADVIQYRCSTIARSAFIKSLIFTFVMIPDLAILPLGFLGILIGLVFIDLVRIWVEIVVDALKPRERYIFRGLVFGAVAVVAFRAITCTVLSHNFAETLQSAAGFGFLLELWAQLQAQTETWYGAAALAPFRWIASIIVADSMSIAVYLKLIVSGAVVLLMTRLTPTIDNVFLNKKLAYERDHLKLAKKQSATLEQDAEFQFITAPSHLGSIGGLGWRQWCGAVNYRNSVLVSLLVPAILSCMPSFASIGQFALVANTTGALAFYSLVLLPASLKFDFRRDIDRLTVLKSLPITPLNACIGQLAVPVLITLAFQLFSLLLVMCISPYNPLFIVGALAVLFPFNLFIFSFENLAFLWYPHRINQEGMQVLIRSILVFTAKSLIFAFAFGVTFIWVLLAKSICETIGGGLLSVPIVFSVGMFLMILSSSLAIFYFLVKAFEKFDPSADLVGLD